MLILPAWPDPKFQILHNKGLSSNGFRRTQIKAEEFARRIVDRYCKMAIKKISIFPVFADEMRIINVD